MNGKFREGRMAKVVRLMREGGASQTAIDAYLKECNEKPPRTFSDGPGRRFSSKVSNVTQDEYGNDNNVPASVAAYQGDYWHD